MTLHGMDVLQSRLEDMLGEDLDEEMEEGVGVWLEKTMALSQFYCPYDTGKLHDSAYTSVYRDGRGRIVAVLGYDTEYAVFVHENPDAYHEPPTQYKFAERAWKEMAPEAVDVISRAVRRKVRSAAR